MRLVTAALTATLLAACSPEYNWREVHSADDDYRVMLPGKPASMTRTIRLESLQVPMTMQGARVGESSFTVAVATLPDDRQATRDRAQAAMRAGMLQNIAGTETAADAIEIRVVDAAGAVKSTLAAMRVEARGSAQGKPVAMRAGFAARGDRAYQWVILGPGIDREQSQTFIESFKLVHTGP